MLSPAVALHNCPFHLNMNFSACQTKVFLLGWLQGCLAHGEHFDVLREHNTVFTVR